MICTWMNISDDESEFAKFVHFDCDVSLWDSRYLLLPFEHISGEEKFSSISPNVFWSILIELYVLVNNVSGVG